MENVAEALKMAGSVLLFVLALSIVIPLFGRARATSDAVLAYSDRESDYYALGEEYENLFFFVGSGTGNQKTRYVGLDTIIPAIYRSYKENTKILFIDSDDSAIELYKYRGSNGEMISFNSIDLKYTSIPAGSEKEFIDGIVYGDFTTRKADYEEKFSIKLNSNIVDDTTRKGLYDYLKTREITEQVGVYYQEDVTNIDPDNVPEANKDEKRVITYQIQN